MFSIPLEEQETIINITRLDDNAKVETFDSTVMTKLDRLCEESPENWKCIKNDGYRKIYTCPKKLISYRAKIVSKELTEEQRAEMADRMRKIRESLTSVSQENS